MRARTERMRFGEPLAWLAAAIWLWAGQTAWAQGPAASTEARGRTGSLGSLGLKAGAEIPPAKIQELYRRILSDWSAGQTVAPDGRSSSRPRSRWYGREDPQILLK